MVIAGGYPLSIGDGSRAIRESPYRNQCLCSKRSETPLLLAEDPALMVRADTTAPVFNDEEKRARATPQVHKVARGGYRVDVGTFAFSAGCDSATTLFAGARHVGVLHLLFARELRLRRKWRGAFDQLPCLVHAPDVAAMTTVVVNASAFAQGRQEPDSLTVARWTLLDVGHGWGNSHHPSGTVSALSGNSLTAVLGGPFPGVAQHFG